MNHDIKPRSSQKGFFPLVAPSLATAVTPVLASVLAFFLATISMPVTAQPLGSDDKVAVEAKLDHASAAPGSDVVLAVVLDHEEHWHVHTQAPIVPEGSNFYAIATEVEASVTESESEAESAEDAVTDEEPVPFAIHDAFTQWPEAHTIEVNFTGEPFDYAVFEGRAVVFVPITVDAQAAPGTYDINVKASFQACDDSSCLMPSSVSRTVTLTIGDAAQRIDDPDFAGFDGSVWATIHAGGAPPVVGQPGDTATDDSESADPITFDFFVGSITLDPSSPTFYASLLGLALVGGFILNFTPCVLPVIPLKVMALTQGDHDKSKALMLATIMLAGVMAFWLVIGGLLAGTVLSAVGELFGYWWFSVGIGVFMIVMSVMMMGLLGTMNLPTWVYNFNPKQDSVLGSFGFGIMTAVLATPCTGPFLGAALGFATQQSAFTILSVFAAIGFGMGFPYLLLTAFPALVSKLPKAGPGSELLKQVMGGLMLAASAYFVGVGINALLSDGESANSPLFWWVVGGLMVATGLWLVVRLQQIGVGTGSRVTFSMVGVLLAAAGVAVGVSLSKVDQHIPWVYFTPERMAALQQEGDVLVIDFTADWCLVCKTLEKSQLEQDRVVERLASRGVSPIKVDLTSDANEAGWAFLGEAGAASIPWLIVMTPEGDIVYRSEAYTADAVLEAIDLAESGAATSAVAAR